MRNLLLLALCLGLAPSALATGVEEQAVAIRVAVRDFEVTGFDERKAKIVTDALLVELRKLDHVSVISMAEIRELLELEAEKQTLGCDDETSCLSEVVDALGADVLLLGSIAVVGEETVFGLRRLDQSAAKVVGQVNRRLEPREGEELLAAIGPAVAELFPERALKPGKTRGVEERVALAINPPPLDPAVPMTAVTIAGVSGGGALLAGVANLIFHGGLQARLDERGKASAPSATEVADRAARVNVSAAAFWGLAGVAAVSGATAGITALFADWEGLRDAQLE